MANERAFANQKREMQLQRLQKLARGLLLATATVLTFATVGLLAADQLYRPDTFVIKQLKIRGAFNHITTEQVREALAEEDLGNFFSVDLLARGITSNWYALHGQSGFGQCVGHG